MNEPKDDEPKDEPHQDKPAFKVKTRTTIRKWHGDDTSGEPFETVIVNKDEGFDEIVEKSKEEKDDASH